LQKLRSSLPGFSGEDASSYTADLNSYMTSLLSHHQIIATEELLVFLDEDAQNSAVDLSSLDVPTAVQLLLAGSEMRKATVRAYGKEEMRLSATAGSVVVWTFSTVGYDIGFSVELNGEPRVPYTRYKSHEKQVEGALEIATAGTVVLIFDNTYAKSNS
jgi:hypothetical protein